jgi:hypothetical protein
MSRETLRALHLDWHDELLAAAEEQTEGAGDREARVGGRWTAGAPARIATAPRLASASSAVKLRLIFVSFAHAPPAS